MLVIVEGPDGAGKSTLVEKLRAVIHQRYPGEKVEVLRKRPPAKGSHPLDEYETPLLSYRPRQGHHIICDRWSWGEWVYPDVLGRKTLADRASWYHIELFLQARGAVIVYMNEPVDVLQRRVIARGDDLVKPFQLEKISQRYDFTAQTSLLPQWAITPHSGRIVSWAESAEREHVGHNSYVTYVGQRFPNTVLLGDVRHNTFEGDLRPAFMPYRGTSGHYLLTHLRREQLNDVGILNACDVDDVNWFTDQHTTHDVSYVALGQNAHKKMRNLGKDQPGVPHPALIRRFHHAAGQQYAEVIQRVAMTREDLITWRP